MENIPISFDFSKAEEQKRFDRLPQNLKDMIIAKAHDMANQMQELIATGKAKNYAEALKQVRLVESEQHTAAIIIESSGDVYLDAGNGGSLMGNIYEGARGSGSNDSSVVNDSIVNENLARILADIYQLTNAPAGHA
ncbi:hypothetical protein EPO05_01565 [Patescibacteria group bacterium]|nr:MAG: hypothetical protein EPO05_01565 [Patescibacteria group bacterium]